MNVSPVGALEAILLNLELTPKFMAKSEKETSMELIQFELTTKTSMISKKKLKSTAEFDPTNSKIKIMEPMDDLEKHQKMLDAASETLKDPQSVLVDTDMSYAYRVRSRKNEIDTLKTVPCRLDANKVEAGAVQRVSHSCASGPRPFSGRQRSDAAE